MNSENLISVAIKVSRLSDLQFLSKLEKIIDQEFKYYEILVLSDSCKALSFSNIEACVFSLRSGRCIMFNQELQEDEQVRALIEHAIGDYVVFFDPNTDDANMISALVEKAASGASLVTVEYSNSNQISGYIIAARIFYWALWLLTGISVPANTSHLICINRKLANAIQGFDGPLLHLRFFAFKYGFPTETLQGSAPPPRLTFRLLLRRMIIAIDIASNVSHRLVKMAALLSLLASLLSALYLLYVFAVYMFFSNIQAGWTTTSVLISSMFSALFFVLFAIGITCSALLKRSSQERQCNYVQEFSSCDKIYKFSKLNIEDRQCEMH